MFDYIKEVFSFIWAFIVARGTPKGAYLNMMDPNNWEVGPIINGQNLSKGMAEHPYQGQEGLDLPIPYPTSTEGSLHYFTAPVGSLENCKKLYARYNVATDPGVNFIPTKFPDNLPMVTLYFQRRFDTWSAQGEYESYRWYASFATQTPITVGEHVIEADLDANWTAILTSSTKSNPEGFLEAKKHASRVGLVFGGGDGLGHGVYATGPAVITLLEFKVE